MALIASGRSGWGRSGPTRIAVTIATGLVLAACGEAPPSRASPADLPGSPTTSAAGEERPALPGGFPVPPEAVALPLTSDPQLIARWRMPGFGSAAYDFYSQALPAAGYPITLLGPGGNAAIIRFEVAPGVVWQVDITGDLDSTLIELRPEHP